MAGSGCLASPVSEAGLGVPREWIEGDTGGSIRGAIDRGWGEEGDSHLSKAVGGVPAPIHSCAVMKSDL